MARNAALIVGMTKYDDSGLMKLSTPHPDINALASVFRNSQLCSFDHIDTIENETVDKVRRAISRFVKARERDDLIVFYFSGHGLKDEEGTLYLAATDTEHDILSATAIPASFVDTEMKRSNSRRQLIILDCCYSGAIGRGIKASIANEIGTKEIFDAGGYGRVVLTATDATQYAWEGNVFEGKSDKSVFTHCLIEGIQTGNADTEPDGRITVDELFEYISTNVAQYTPNQKPRKFVYDQNGGSILIARNPFARKIRKRETAKPPSEDVLGDYCQRLITHIAEGRLVVFLGTDFNLSSPWASDGSLFSQSGWVPSNAELSLLLADRFEYPDNNRQDLAHVGEYVTEQFSRYQFAGEMKKMLHVDWNPTPAHASIVAIASAARKSNASLCVITTNYDDALEFNFKAAGEPFYLLAPAEFGTEPLEERRWMTKSATNEDWQRMDPPSPYWSPPANCGALIVKVYGGIESGLGLTPLPDSGSHAFLPNYARAQISSNSILFLGVSPNNAYDRPFVNSIFRRRDQSYISDIAVAWDAAAAEYRFWQSRNVTFIPLSIDRFLQELSSALNAKPAPPS